jgi:UDP-N-acetylmuramoyl-L-alanyl-D-glutamate--2,6-diaminopimelate ligase
MQQTLDRAHGISLRHLLAEGRFFGGNDIHVTSCSGDAAACRSGDLFVARVGVEDDGHNHVEEALQNGAVAVLAERHLSVNVPFCIVPNTHQAYGQVCQKLAGEPAETMQVVGVTGTNGKTTTNMLIASILQAGGQQVGVTSTIGHSDSYDVAPSQRSTPAPPELAHWLSRMAANGCSHAVMEVSSCGLAEHRLAGVRLDAAVLTNLRRDHVGFHGSVLNYRKIKTRLFHYLKPGGYAVVNVDDPGSRFALSKLDCPVITVAMNEDAEIMATVVERHASEQTFLLEAGNETVPVRTRMIGDHHVANCLAAAAVGLVQGLDLTTVARGLESVERVPGRMDRVECGQAFNVFVDCADTADRLAVCLNSIRKVSRGRLFCVFSSDDEFRCEERPLLGRVAERASDVGVITSSGLPGAESLDSAHDILDGYERPARAHVIPTRTQAILWALGEAKPGDAVLIAGSQRACGWAAGSGLDDCHDTKIARSWLYNSANQAGDSLTLS